MISTTQAIESKENKLRNSSWDVVICGGGLAGLTLSLQLVKRMPDIKVLVLERSNAAPKDACHKVGESCVEGATYWFTHTLGLKDYLWQKHIKKLGLRFFGTNNGQDSFKERFEIGVNDFPPIDSVQLDRGLFERDLIKIAREAGVTVITGVKVESFSLSEKNMHHIQLKMNHHKSLLTIQGSWLVDASGRSRLLSRKLNLTQPLPHNVSATWFRLKGKCDISNIVNTTHNLWHKRTKQARWYSTNHLLGRGYWIWLIPLSTGHTSIGIMGEETVHPLTQRNSWEKALQWFSEYEPDVFKLIREFEVLDFRTMKHIAYETKQAFSINRWACVGEAAAFADPLYSTGSDLIAWANSSVTTLIELDRKGKLDNKTVALYDTAFKDLVSFVSSWTINMYSVFGHDHIMLRKLLWDALAYFLGPVRILLHEFLQTPASMQRYTEEMQRCYKINQKMQELFREWVANTNAEKARPGLYVADQTCNYFNDLARLQLGVLPGFKFLNELPGFIDKMEELADIFGAQAEAHANIKSPFKLPQEQLFEQVENYMMQALA